MEFVVYRSPFQKKTTQFEGLPCYEAGAPAWGALSKFMRLWFIPMEGYSHQACASNCACHGVEFIPIFEANLVAGERCLGWLGSGGTR